MESTTILLAQLWGPAILAVGLGIFISKGYYAKIYRDIEEEPLALLLFGFVGVMVGVFHIQIHNVWNTLPEIVVSFFGWALLIKALVFLIKPRLVDNWADYVVGTKIFSLIGVMALILGGYLSWVGYFMM